MAEVEDSEINYKYASPLNLNTGFKIYDDAYASAPSYQGKGTPVMAIFDGAAKLMATSAAIVLTLAY